MLGKSSFDQEYEESDGEINLGINNRNNNSLPI